MIKKGNYFPKPIVGSNITQDVIDNSTSFSTKVCKKHSVGGSLSYRRHVVLLHH